MKGEVVVIGGGAAGMMAALAARETGAPVTLLERNPKVGRKLYITGKGRCNLTNSVPPSEVLEHVLRNSRFLNSSLRAFPPEAVMEWFVRHGVPLKVERGNRVFPVSDQSSDVIDALFRALRQSGVRLVEGRATALRTEGGRLSAVEANGTVYPAGAAILATGGLSYPATGSTGDGYRLAQSVGHSVTPLAGSLVGLEAEGCAPMQGLSLKNVTLSVKNSAGKTLFSQQGELLFTHYGLSGPLVLSASANLCGRTAGCTACIDLKPALTPEQLDGRILRDGGEWANRDMGNYALSLAPRLLAPVLLERAGIPAGLKVHSLTKAARRTLVERLKGLSFPILGPRPVEEAVVTAGGVAVKEVDPKTMASKLLPGLYFAGEILDVDAYTGGFNLQIAWSTGRAAGLGAGNFVNGSVET